MAFSAVFDRYSVPAVVLGLAILYLVALPLYNLYLHPLAGYPGPKLAALTSWYEFYHDGIKGGQYFFKIKEMHEKYGPIVRITPNEVHINDPDFLSTIFCSSGKRRNKYEIYTRIFGGSEAAIATVEHDIHKMRRGALNRYFSKESVRRVERIIQAAIQKLFQRFEDYKGSGRPLEIVLAYSAFTSDIITEYAFGKSYDYLDVEDFNRGFFEMMVSVHGIAPWARMFKWLLPLMDSIPSSIVRRMDPGMDAFFNFQEEMRNRIRTVKNKPGFYEGLSHPTVFHEILASDLPTREKTVERLWQEAQVITVAGTETTAWTLTVLTYYLLSNPVVMNKLRHELESAIPDISKLPSGKELEQLPYLTAVIQEGLRLSYGVTARQQRSCPDEVTIYSDGKRQWRIPEGTPIATSGPLIHLNPSIFPDPYEFKPSRWLDNPRLDKYLWSFSKGSRQCLGINLAYAELYICVAAVFRRYTGPEEKYGKQCNVMELFQTTREDVEFARDMFVPFPKEGSKGVRVILK